MYEVTAFVAPGHEKGTEDHYGQTSGPFSTRDAAERAATALLATGRIARVVIAAVEARGAR